MTREETMAKIASYGIREYGVYARPLEELLKELDRPDCVVAALNNADTDGVLLEILDKDFHHVLFGLKLAGEATGAERLVLQLPAFAAETAEALRPRAEEAGVSVGVGLVNRRASRNSVLTHIVTMAELGAAAEGAAQPGVYVSVNGGQLQKLPGDTTLDSLLGEKVRAVVAGYTLRGPEALSLTLEQVELENGVLRGLSEKDCVVDEVAKQLLKCRAQSCGKCVFCREGLIQLQETHKDITAGRSAEGKLDLMAEVGEAMGYSTPCSMGQRAAELPLSAMKLCREEYLEHIKKRHCSADRCLAFVTVYVDPQRCTGCEQCRDVCSTHAIDSRPGYIHMVDDFDCTKCGQCVPVCPESAIVRTTGRVPKLPERFIKVGKFKRH